MMLVFWVLVIVGVVAAVRWMTACGVARPRAETPTEILRRRYAAGELTKEQFESMKRDVAYGMPRLVDMREVAARIGLEEPDLV